MSNPKYPKDNGPLSHNQLHQLAKIAGTPYPVSYRVDWQKIASNTKSSAAAVDHNSQTQRKK